MKAGFDVLGQNCFPLISRRGVITGLMASLLLRKGKLASAEYPDYVTPVDLGHGLEIRDYRLFPTDDAMRFIVEIHNRNDFAIDSPVIGMVLTESKQRTLIGWAVPAEPVLHAGSSSCLVGVAPQLIRTSADFDPSYWTLCNDPQKVHADTLQGTNINLTWEMESTTPTAIRAMLRVINEAAESTPPLAVHGLVWDKDDRICGATGVSKLGRLEPEEAVHLGTTASEEFSGLLNPLNLIDTFEGARLSFSVQTVQNAVNPGCASIWSWDQKSFQW